MYGGILTPQPWLAFILDLRGLRIPFLAVCLIRPAWKVLGWMTDRERERQREMAGCVLCDLCSWMQGIRALQLIGLLVLMDSMSTGA